MIWLKVVVSASCDKKNLLDIRKTLPYFRMSLYFIVNATIILVMLFFICKFPPYDSCQINLSLVPDTCNIMTIWVNRFCLLVMLQI